MDYRSMSEEFLSCLSALGKQKRTKEIGNSMKGEAFTLLYIALAGKPVSPGEIVNAMEISSARVAAMLNSLEKKGMLSREIDPNDRRKIVVKLTQAGQEKADSLRECSVQLVTMMMEKLGEEDAMSLLRIIGKISGFLTDMTLTKDCREEETEDVI